MQSNEMLSFLILKKKRLKHGDQESYQATSSYNLVLWTKFFWHLHQIFKAFWQHKLSARSACLTISPEDMSEQ